MANVPQNLCPIIIVVEVAIPFHPLLVVSATVEECFLLIHLNGNIAVSIHIKIHFCVQFQMGENCLMMSLYLSVAALSTHPYSPPPLPSKCRGVCIKGSSRVGINIYENYNSHIERGALFRHRNAFGFPLWHPLVVVTLFQDKEKGTFLFYCKARIILIASISCTILF